MRHWCAALEDLQPWPSLYLSHKTSSNRCMALFQRQHQGPCPAVSLSLWLSGVNFRTSGLSNSEQLVSSDCHFTHFKGVAVFHKSTFLLCSNTFMVMSPHILAILTDPFQLSLHPETAFAQSTGSPYPLAGTSFRPVHGWTLHPCLSMRCSLQRLCLCQSHLHSPLVSQSLMLLNPQCSVSFLQLLHATRVSYGPSQDGKGGCQSSCCPVVQSLIWPPVLVLACYHCTHMGSCDYPQLWLLGSQHRSSCFDEVKWATGRAAPFLLCGGG